MSLGAMASHRAARSGTERPISRQFRATGPCRSAAAAFLRHKSRYAQRQGFLLHQSAICDGSRQTERSSGSGRDCRPARRPRSLFRQSPGPHGSTQSERSSEAAVSRRRARRRGSSFAKARFPDGSGQAERSSEAAVSSAVAAATHVIDRHRDRAPTPFPLNAGSLRRLSCFQPVVPHGCPPMLSTLPRWQVTPLGRRRPWRDRRRRRVGA
jgi:hypothetical protein